MKNIMISMIIVTFILLPIFALASGTALTMPSERGVYVIDSFVYPAHAGSGVTYFGSLAGNDFARFKEAHIFHTEGSAQLNFRLDGVDPTAGCSGFELFAGNGLVIKDPGIYNNFRAFVHTPAGGTGVSLFVVIFGK